MRLGGIALLLALLVGGGEITAECNQENPIPGNPVVLSTELYTIVTFKDPIELETVALTVHSSVDCVATETQMKDALDANSAAAYAAYVDLFRSKEKDGP